MMTILDDVVVTVKFRGRIGMISSIPPQGCTTGWEGGRGKGAAACRRAETEGGYTKLEGFCLAFQGVPTSRLLPRLL